ncbi:hypothetical protein DQW77_08945 [Roseovarius sp. TE539]|uniref:hypothetical protein n=1 Tax=Roseovarius sp. TE539 TaxID=2249812 RepID=UPI000DDECCF9|nr:hypothetical protein [Roseovarius sp. TE539]RBI73516.1 hypothetical protein DQW77_08945 [Roseovarius sp. TE539]
MGEVELAGLLCAFLAGSESETRHYFDGYEMKRHVRVDCETARHVIEVGLDGKSSARDSVHQALFFAHLTDKEPVVILIDRDGYVGRFEHEMGIVAPAAGVTYARCAKAAILRWSETAAMRPDFGDDSRDDLPAGGLLGSLCDLNPLAADELGS